MKRIVNTSNELTHPVMLNTEMGAIKVAIDALSNVLDTNVGDTIRRQDAIDALNKLDVSDGVGISSIACDLQEEAIRSIKNLQSVQSGRWIPCSERKPKQQQQVIITDEGDVLTGYINSLNEWMDFHGNRLKGVIAWMPLPEPYKENES